MAEIEMIITNDIDLSSPVKVDGTDDEYLVRADFSVIGEDAKTAVSNLHKSLKYTGLRYAVWTGEKALKADVNLDFKEKAKK